MKETLKDIFIGFKDSPLAMLCMLLVCGFAWIYNDMRNIIFEQRDFLVKMHQTQMLMNESLKELNVRMNNIETNFRTTPEQLKELILILHKHDIDTLNNHER